MKYATVIIGAGAAGVAAATRLLRGGVNNIVILEAENRIGGRVHSIKFDGSTIDMGAQWVHGETDNAVFALASPKGLVEPDELMSNWASAEFYTETGARMDEDMQSELYSWLTDIDSAAQVKLRGFKGSLGDYFTKEYTSRLDQHKEIDRNMALKFLDWYEKFENSIDAADSWFETSGSGHLAYVDCEGALLNKWTSGGYHSALQILIDQLPSASDFLERVQLNKEVTSISWDQVPGSGVTVSCSDGTKVSAERVIVTVSLGVLKERAANLFSPPLPQYKATAIQGLAIGSVDKIYLSFPHRWWPEDGPGFCMLWTKQDDDLPQHQRWLRDVFGFFPVSGAPRVLCGWIVGPPARHMEGLGEGEVTRGCMQLLRRFLGHKYQVPDCLEMCRSTWYSNPHFRGSYSFRSMETDRLCTDAAQLAAPLCDSAGKPVVQFAGEATHNKYFSTVHGAIESGWREADRILSQTKPGGGGEVTTHEVVIVGAGMAGLGAARTLAKAGITDFVILEAQDRPGGRARTEGWGGSEGRIVEAGAQWIHGEHGNPLYKIAERHGLIADTISAEGLGPYVREDGCIFDSALVSEVASKVEGILEECERFAEDPGLDPPPSMGHYLRDRFQQYLATTSKSAEERRMREELFDWHLRFQVIDNSCHLLEDLSAKAWGKYDMCSGRDYTNLSHGYTSLVDILVQDVPRQSLHLSTPVSTIQYQSNLDQTNLSPSIKSQLNIKDRKWIPPVLVTCQNGRKFAAQYVIVTCSIGVLKLCHQSMFIPALPSYLTSPLSCLGFETITKVYLDYDEPWWSPEEKGFQLIWSKNTPLNPSRSQACSWTRDMSGFDVLPGPGHVLLGWVGGEGAKLVEELPLPEVGQHCTQLLQRFLGRPITAPARVYRTQWHSNPWVRGAYSHTTDKCDQSGAKPEDLLKPVWAHCASPQLKLPMVMLAGEAAHASHFSTTHGAFETGVTQAQQIISALPPLCTTSQKSKY